MEIIIHRIGPCGISKEKVFFEESFLPLKRVLIRLLDNSKEKVRPFVNEDLGILDGCVILVNGRNMVSLEGLDTEIRDQDEITFTVLVAGGSGQEVEP